VVVDLLFEHVLADPVAAARRISDRVGDGVAAFERVHQNRAVQHDILGEQGGDLLDARWSGFAQSA
jgi:hypothetical protein